MFPLDPPENLRKTMVFWGIKSKHWEEKCWLSAVLSYFFGPLEDEVKNWTYWLKKVEEGLS